MGDSSSSDASPGRNSELEALQKLHEAKLERIEELKKQKEELKESLEKKKKETPVLEKVEAFKNLTEKYNKLRDEYNALLADKSGEPKD